jgi:hypothetical protein
MRGHENLLTKKSRSNNPPAKNSLSTAAVRTAGRPVKKARSWEAWGFGCYPCSG